MPPKEQPVVTIDEMPPAIFDVPPPDATARQGQDEAGATAPTTTTATAAPHDYTRDARIYEYGSAANPELSPIPILVHAATKHESGPTAIQPFDISDFLQIDYPCTSPNLMASFLRICTGESLTTSATATSQAFYVIRGSGYTETGGNDDDKTDSNNHKTDGNNGNDNGKIEWSTGDMIVFPCTDNQSELQHVCVSAESHGGAALYWIHDEPLLKYLGVQPSARKFETTIFKRSEMLRHVEEIKHSEGHSNNRLGVLLGNAKCDQTKTLTHVLWSLLNSIPAKTVQRPHRHNSVALDLCVSAKPGVYTLMGKEIDADGIIVNPIRCDWVPGAVFVTPPGFWHSHSNESDDTAWVLPVQDAGLYTHQRTLDIRFVDDELALHASGRIRGSAFTVTNRQFSEMQALGGLEPQTARIKRVLSAECLQTHKRRRSVQIGKLVDDNNGISSGLFPSSQASADAVTKAAAAAAAAAATGKA